MPSLESVLYKVKTVEKLCTFGLLAGKNAHRHGIMLALTLSSFQILPAAHDHDAANHQQA